MWRQHNFVVFCRITHRHLECSVYITDSSYCNQFVAHDHRVIRWHHINTGGSSVWF